METERPRPVLPTGSGALLARAFSAPLERAARLTPLRETTKTDTAHRVAPHALLY